MITATSTATPKPFIPGLRSVTDGLSPLAEPLLRLVTGLLLVPHGAQKLFGAFGGYGLEGTGQFFGGQMGLEPGYLWALLVGLTEFFGGLMLAIGLLTRPAALAITIFLAVAVFFHLPSGFFWTGGGYEYPLLWAVAALFFAVRGGGRLSVDRALGREF